jgi:hypothetical protein
MPEQPANEPVIEVTRTDVEQFLSKFLVRVTEDDDTTSSHVVTLSGADWDRLGTGYRSPEMFVEACFTFLFQHEPKEQILASFDVSQISAYFPDFERAITSRPKD